MVDNKLIKGLSVKDNPKLLGIFSRSHKDGGYNFIINGQLLFRGELTFTRNSPWQTMAPNKTEGDN